jgi:uncharacterized Zn-binding protein involved in type VI secretion
MTERALIRQGDRTTHGGTVLTGDPTLIIHGRQAARVGDSVYCPLCKKAGRIITGAPTMVDSQLVARHDDLTDCGAKLIASQFTDVYGDGEESSASATMETRPAQVTNDAVASVNEDESAFNASTANPNDEPYVIRFQAIEAETSKPITKCAYILTRENGVQHGGITNQEGFTETIETEHQEQIAVHFAFTSPLGGVIDREDLS